MDNQKLLPCPFCGSEAKLKGGPMSQENYSIWCKNLHHLDGGMDEQKLIDTWNTRHSDKSELGSWISVKDELPKPIERVLAFDNGGLGVLSAIWSSNGNWYLEGDLDVNANVTHWMPLPEPPKCQQ